MRYNYGVDFGRLAQLLSPVRLRGELFTGMLRLIAAPFDDIHRSLMDTIAAQQRRLDCNGQVCRLEAMLNAIFDNEDRRIRITDGSDAGILWIYLPADPNSQYVLGRDAETALMLPPQGQQYGTDFVVRLNGAALTHEDRERMAALVRKYRLPCKTFAIDPPEQQ